MILKAVLLATTAFAASLPAQYATVLNVDNTSISPSSVVGENVQVTITGAAANSLVTLYYTQNGVPGTWFADYTNASGFWQRTAPAPVSQVGVWTEQWAVGSSNVGPLYSFEIFDLPKSLTVQSVTDSSPQRCGNTYGNKSASATYGGGASIKYQIVGSSGSSETVPSSGLALMLEPIEVVNFYDPFGNLLDVASGDLGTDDTSYPWTPPSAKYAASTGIFYDVPVGTCATFAFSTFRSTLQSIYIVIGGIAYEVRSQNTYANGPSSGHGGVANDIGDISYSR